jgi:hypothetical protein
MAVDLAPQDGEISSDPIQIERPGRLGLGGYLEHG